MPVRGWLGKAKQKLFVPRWLRDELWDVKSALADLDRRTRRLQEALGRVETRQLANQHAESLRDREFRVFSQWGEDGIIQHLVRSVPIPRKVFVEFGVETYQEANTRFLMTNDNWAGLVLDGNAEYIERVRRHPDYWLYNLKAVHGFLTRDNINQLLEQNGVTGEIGLLSIDVDGMDYWLWDAIQVIQPAIVVIEYNYRFGPDSAVTVPYRPDFDRWKAHHSILYYGASLKALSLLGRRKGYALVGCGSAGLNAFFVRRDIKPAELQELAPEAAYVEGQFDEAHDSTGRRMRMSKEEERRLVHSLPLVTVGEEGERQ